MAHRSPLLSVGVSLVVVGLALSGVALSGVVVTRGGSQALPARALAPVALGLLAFAGGVLAGRR